ncbi:MAG: hypothetical protein COT16_00465 [Elusimicrobia bacterium CG08_land_8_20_14_0_20_44_26]|nr:MAG: hypothetical protein COT16_00465 [Elusimicrobia bacterium CG08_land_8_20_14_0_20_44_26]
MSELDIVFSQEPFSLLDSAGRSLFRKSVKIIASKKGQKLITEGEKGSTVYFLLTGCSSVLIDTAKGHLPISHLYPPDFFGEIAVFDELLTGAKRTATVENLTDVRVAAMSSDDFKNLCIQNPVIIKSIEKIYKKRMQQLLELKERIKNI